MMCNLESQEDALGVNNASYPHTLLSLLMMKP